MIALGVFVFAAIVAALPSASSEGGPCEVSRYSRWILVGNIKTCLMMSTAIESADFSITSARDESIKGFAANKISRLQHLPINLGEKYPNLLGLQASECSIKRISKENFKGLSKVRILYLTKNLIETIDDDTFEHLRAVEQIYLDNNRINQLNGLAFTSLNKLRLVYLNNNECINSDFVNEKGYSRWLDQTARVITDKCEFSSTPQIPPKDSKNCGVSLKATLTAKFTYLMIRGENFNRGDFPWMTALYRKLLHKNQTAFFCSGTLISDLHVLTAAHCVQDLHPSNITAEFGAYDLDDHSEVGRFHQSPAKIFVHEQWSPNNTRSIADIAMLLMPERIAFSNYIQPICLWDSEDEATTSEGYIAGWGQSQNYSRLHENIPTMLKVPSHTSDHCYLTYPDIARFSSNRTFCGGSADGRGPCHGDSGGGFYVPEENVFYLKGIVSGGIDVNIYGECRLKQYTIFTNVLKFKSWIDTTMTLK